jgi:hypothetical protein
MSETAADVKFRNLEREIEDLRTTCAEFRKELRGLRDFQIWATGVISAVTFFGGLFAAKIKEAFGL